MYMKAKTCLCLSNSNLKKIQGVKKNQCQKLEAWNEGPIKIFQRKLSLYLNLHIFADIFICSNDISYHISVCFNGLKSGRTKRGSRGRKGSEQPHTIFKLKLIHMCRVHVYRIPDISTNMPYISDTLTREIYPMKSSFYTFSSFFQESKLYVTCYHE